MTAQNHKQRRPRIRGAVFVCIAVIALIIDQLTKYFAQITLEDYKSVPVIPGLLSFTLVHNPGASLGLGSQMTWLIAILAAVACVVLVYLAWRTNSIAWTVFFALAFAGAFGNLIDRFVYANGFLNGKVIDFLDYGWSVGNVADIFLMIAGVGIVFLILFNVPFHSSSESEHA